MPTAAAKTSTNRQAACPSAASASSEARPSASPRVRLATGLLSALSRFAGAPGERHAAPATEHRAPARSVPNRCEFDYDYYVALQSRRRHQPSRLDLRERQDHLG